MLAIHRLEQRKKKNHHGTYFEVQDEQNFQLTYEEDPLSPFHYAAEFLGVHLFQPAARSLPRPYGILSSVWCSDAHLSMHLRRSNP